MYASTVSAEDILSRALAVLGTGEQPLLAALDELPAPVYVTDAEGLITYFNSACVDFAGRTPEPGKDRWCVSWKLYTDDGRALPHDQCPMATAIQTREAVRGVSAVAERPDGTRVTFVPYPTPLFTDDGSLRGAVNMLIDVTDTRQVEFLLAQAEKCRRLARSICDTQTTDTLGTLAVQYEEKARELAIKSGNIALL
jgi:PAS domain S-box-containing protein